MLPHGSGAPERPPGACAPSLLLTANFPPLRGGTPRLFWELYRRAPPGRARVLAGTLPDRADLASAPDLRVARLAVPFPEWPLFSAGGVVRYRAAVSALRRELTAGPARAVHAARLLPEGWIARRCAERYACWVHGEELNSIASSRQLRWMARRVLRDATLLMANSRHTARLLVEGFEVDPARIEVLLPGVDCAWFQPAPPDAAARARLGWCGRLVVLTVARLQARKGHLRLLDALPALAARHPNLLWAVIGEGEMRRELERRVAAAGLAAHVRCHGEVDERRLLDAYQQCDLFVLPNVEIDGDVEGFGMVLLEAQACGRPVIAGASGGTREAMVPGESGLLVDCADPTALGAALERLLGAPEQRRVMGERGRQWASGFDWGVTAAAAVELWERRGV